MAERRRASRSDQCRLSRPPRAASNFVPLTPALLRRLADAHYLNVYEADFQWRGDLWKKVHEDEDAFWHGKIIKLPEDDWVEFKGAPHSYFTGIARRDRWSTASTAPSRP